MRRRASRCRSSSPACWCSRCSASCSTPPPRSSKSALPAGLSAARQTGEVKSPQMARVPYEDEIIISWVELHRDARYLSEVLHQKGPWKGIIAVTRGGLVPAALVARELDIRLVDTICVTSYDSSETGAAAKQQGEVQVLKGVAGDGDGYLLIDDLVDTGRTAQAVRRLLPKAYFATLYAKPAGRAIVDTFVKEFKQTKWIHFPWDIEYSFATPIKDGGRVAAGP